MRQRNDSPFEHPAMDERPEVGWVESAVWLVVVVLLFAASMWWVFGA